MNDWLLSNIKLVLEDVNKAQDKMVKELGVTYQEAKMGTREWYYDSFEYQEDFISFQECEDCGWMEDGEVMVGEETGECPQCSSMGVINSTNHEGQQCMGCNKTLDMWEDVYAYEDNGDLLCEECNEKLNQAVESIET